MDLESIPKAPLDIPAVPAGNASRHIQPKPRARLTSLSGRGAAIEAFKQVLQLFGIGTSAAATDGYLHA